MNPITRIHGTSAQCRFDCGDVVIVGSGEFRAKSGKIDGFILYADSLRYEDGPALSVEERYELKSLYQEFIKNHYDSVDWDI